MTTPTLAFAAGTAPAFQKRIGDLLATHARGEQLPRGQWISLHPTRIVGETENGPVIRFAMFTEGIKRDGDEFMTAGADLANIRANPRVMWAHKYDTFPVGNWLRVERIVDPVLGPIIEGDAAPLRTTEGTEHLKEARMLFRMYGVHDLDAISGGWRSTSIEAIQDDQGNVRGVRHLESDVLEASMVPIGADAQALQRGIRSAMERGVITGDESELFVRHMESGVYVVRDTPTAPEAPSDPLSRATDALAALGTRQPETARPPLVARDPLPRPPDTPSSFERIAPLHARAYDVHGVMPNEPLRTNRQLPEAFDIAAEILPPASETYRLLTRYLGVETKRIAESSFDVRGARMGAFLAALEQTTADGWAVEDVRNLVYDGTERPPGYETIRHNSKTSGTYLIDGMRFLRHTTGVRAVLRVQPDWGGLVVTTYSARGAPTAVVDALVDATHTRAAEFRFLQGEAFSLSGEFLERGAVQWGDVFLTDVNSRALTTAATRLKDKGRDAPNRGILMAGPPGTGKTLSGRALMRDLDGVTFVWISARDFYRYGAFSGIANAFDLAHEYAPAVLFFEDVDNWIGERGVDLLKTEMDGIKQTRGALTILTTNHPEAIPEALIDRPGRFHDVLKIDLPDADTRDLMLARWAPDVGTSARAAVVEATEGYSGAHLYELAAFARGLGDDESLAPDEALQRALAKVVEQRELINSLQGRYTPSAEVRAAAEARRGATRGPRLVAHQGGEMVVPLPRREVNVTLNKSDVSHDEIVRAVIAGLDGTLETRSGAVLSRKNRDAIEEVAVSLEQQAAALRTVLVAATPTADDLAADPPPEEAADARAMQGDLEDLRRQVGELRDHSAASTTYDTAMKDLLTGVQGLRTRSPDRATA